MRLSALRISTGVAVRVAAFLLIAALAVTWGAVTYVKVPRLLGLDRYAATVQLPSGSGLYVNGVVALRGVTVGQIDAVRVTPQGAEADIQIADDVRIPRNSTVEVRSISAVGEQYINFEPATADGPFLADGDVIPAERVTLPVTTAELLEEVNGLAASVPGAKLNTTVDQLYEAFQGTGQDMQRLIDSTALLTAEAAANVDPTVRLIEDAAPVLDTQRATAGDIRTYFGNLARFTGQLAADDGDLRGVLSVFPPALDEVAGFVQDVGDPLPSLLSNLTAVGDVTRVYIPHLAQTLTFLQPTFTRSIGTVTSSPVPGTIKINLQAQVNDPPPCLEGYIPERRPPSDTSPARPGSGVRCVDDDPTIAVRSGKNYLCPPGSPRPEGRAPDAAGCGLQFQSPQDAAAAREEAIRTMLDVASRQSTHTRDAPLRPPNPSSGPNTDSEENYRYGDEYLPPSGSNPLTGIFLAPGSSTPIVYGNDLPSRNEGWASLVLDPLGLEAPEGGR
jgi:phospholipid/cholesterol/gamma-HCH transport system substrate-binding protein